MPLFDFRCPDGHITERLVPAGTAALGCACGATAERAAVHATAIGGRQRTPVAERRVSLRQYDEASQQLAYQHAQSEESAQRPLPTPPLARMAIRQAQQLKRAGVTDSLDVRP